jgi:hypothetical protein
MDLKIFLNNKYKPEDFITFLEERFYGFEPNFVSYTDENLSESEKKEIKGYKYLGSMELDDGKEIGFFEFLSKTSNIENKRVGFNKILKKIAQDYMLDGAIASFYHPNSNAWRLSFVGFEYDEGKTEVTNLKRYTYVLGKNIPTKTAYMQLKNLKYPKFEELKEIFSVERVTKEFYEKYRMLFEKVKDNVTKVYGNILNEGNKKIELFSKKLLGRVIFLYFLQKKGWLGVEKDKKWGEGRKDFLYYFFKKAKKENINFYEEYLKKIFFEALNKKRDNDYFKALDCKIPFLNGGLFEADKLDKEFLYLDNTLFEEIFNIFNEYNFTIIEDSPDDKEVAVDPEMMGRVFENLLDENYRKGKGAFYTPREIVHYMCQQTIIDNLLNYFDNKKAIINLVIKKETDNDFIIKYAKEIKERLLSLKILDPAIGSGAFPMGLLHEIVSIVQALDKTMNQKEIAKLKRYVIENCIYGIDIDYSAVEIAKLRFWLSLVVEEEEPIPLPNLYYKIMVGNSLFETINGDDLLNEDSSLFDSTTEKIKKIQKLIHIFFNTNEAVKKTKLKQKIENKIDEVLISKLEEQKDIINSNLKNYKGKNTQTKNIESALEKSDLIKKIKKRPTTELFFYKIYFADVLYNGGFDIVIGNPPYIRQEKIKEIKARLQKEHFYNPITQQKEKYECFNSTADIYIYFFEKGFRLLSKNGILSFITSNKYTRAKYGQKFREFLLKNADIKEFIDFNGVKVFESATVDTAILSFSHKKEKSPMILYCDIKEDYQQGQDLFNYIQKKGFLYPQENLDKNAFTFLSPQELQIKKRIEKVGIPLKEWDVKINFGIKTGFNEAFIIDKKTKEKLIKEDKKSAEIIKPLLRGRDIKKYGYEFNELYLINAHNNPPVNVKKDYPAIYKHLLQYKDKLEKRWDKGENWWNLRNCAYLDEFEKEKIIFSRIIKQPQFHYDVEKFYIEATGYILIGKCMKYLTALLNSELIFNIFYRFYSGGGIDGEIKKNKLELVPIPQISKEKQKPFENLVDIIIKLKKNNQNSKFFEDVIDVMVYELYFEDEINKKRLNIIDKVSKILQKTANLDEIYELLSQNEIQNIIKKIKELEFIKVIENMH